MWNVIDEGKTIGTTGSEDGVIEKDEEFNNEARITLEKCENYYVITCGIYGGMMHTVFCDESEKDTIYEDMKKDLQKFLINDATENEELGFYEEFTNKY